LVVTDRLSSQLAPSDSTSRHCPPGKKGSAFSMWVHHAEETSEHPCWVFRDLTSPPPARPQMWGGSLRLRWRPSESVRNLSLLSPFLRSRPASRRRVPSRARSAPDFPALLFSADLIGGVDETSPELVFSLFALFSVGLICSFFFSSIYSSPFLREISLVSLLLRVSLLFFQSKQRRSLRGSFCFPEKSNFFFAAGRRISSELLPRSSR